MLQQYLPLAVLKHSLFKFFDFRCIQLQQYLPLAVLKLNADKVDEFSCNYVATVLTACGIETVAHGMR